MEDNNIRKLPHNNCLNRCNLSPPGAAYAGVRVLKTPVHIFWCPLNYYPTAKSRLYVFVHHMHLQSKLHTNILYTSFIINIFSA